MKIYSMTATFGKLENKTLTFQPGLHVIEAPNEWGKSTWCAFLTAMLYGIDTRERTTAGSLAVKERYAPWSGLPMAGRIDLRWQNKDITIQRSTKGRIPMGEFKAFETATGITVPELTADNCGKMLLGVEKSVFVRTGFIRLADMPVTQDDALRRRLNELVTTGDESGQSDDLAQKLRDLKNKVRANRSKGLIPQVLAEKAALENKLQQLDALENQAQTLLGQQAELTRHTDRLRNHKNALAWHAVESRIKKRDDANRQLAAVTEQIAILERSCAQLPDEKALQTQLARAKQLQNQKDTLQLELAMLPAPPAAPQGLTPHDPEQAKKDFETYQELSKAKMPAKGLLVVAGIGVAFILAGILLKLYDPASLARQIAAILLAGLGAMALAIPGGLYAKKARLYKKNAEQIKELTNRYAPLPPENWVSAAESYVNQNSAYQASLAAYEENRSHLQSQLQQVLAELSSLPATDGHSAAIDRHRTLTDALREQQYLQQLVQTLESAEALPEKPATEDTLTFTESETANLLADANARMGQLHTRLGQVQGQMEALGNRQHLQEQITLCNQRLAGLEQTFAALELAQNTLVQATSELQRRFAPAITKQTIQYFSRITGGRYDKLTLTQELALETAATDEPVTRQSLFRSEGTLDQLYLSLRLAVADALTPEAPLVLDDALVRFDDVRLAETMALLKELAATRQVILFTCQGRESKHI